MGLDSLFTIHFPLTPLTHHSEPASLHSTVGIGNFRVLDDSRLQVAVSCAGCADDPHDCKEYVRTYSSTYSTVVRTVQYVLYVLVQYVLYVLFPWDCIHECNFWMHP